MDKKGYRGRIAPSPTGFLHAGHARTFWFARQRASEFEGKLILRIEDLDRGRCKQEYVDAILTDLKWFGISWQEGPDCGGDFGPYSQSRRMHLYRQAFEHLKQSELVYPCLCSRQDVLRAASAPHPPDEEVIYPSTCRPLRQPTTATLLSPAPSPPSTGAISWRFRVPDGTAVCFTDGRFGDQKIIAGRDFGDFVVWRQDGTPAYQLAVVVDDAAMQITEVVRGADLLLSTARQILLYQALGLHIPRFHHLPLVTNEHGARLSKRDAALGLRHLRERGLTPALIRREWFWKF